MLIFDDYNYDEIFMISISCSAWWIEFIIIVRTLNVKLNNHAEIIKWLRELTFDQLADLVRSSNPQVVADYAAGLITVLNQVNADHLKEIFLFLCFCWFQKN